MAVGGIIGAATAGSGWNGENNGNGNHNNNNNSAAYSYIGETVKSGSIEFTVNRVDNKTLLGSEIVGASTEYNFIVIELKIVNTGNSEVNLTSSNFELTKDNSVYELHTGSIYLDNGFYALETLGSGLSKTILIAFETPTTSTQDIYTLNVKGSIYLQKRVFI